jgi:hypothetical protein
MSADLASSLPIHQSLTSDMQLGMKTTAPKSRSYRVSITPSNKSVFVPLDQMIFDIPTGRHGTWLDQSQSYLKFSVQFASTAAVNQATASSGVSTGIWIDNSAYSFIQRLDVYQGSNQLETIGQYGELCNYLLDQQLSQADKAGLSAMLGTNPYSYSVNTGATYAQYGGVVNVVSAGDRSGLPVASTTAIAGSVPYTFTLPVLSGVVGVNASKMIPLKDLTGTINLQFFLAANDDAIYYGTAGAGATWQILNAEMVCCFVEIEDDAFNHSDPRMPQYISSQTYRQVSSTIPNGAVGEQDLLIGLRASSLTQLIARFRNQAAAVQGANATASYRLSSSVAPGALGSYYWRVNNQYIPQKPVYFLNGSLIGTGAEGMAEISKAFHALGSIICNGSISHSMYNVAQVATQGFTLANAPSAIGAAGTLSTAYNAFSISNELQTFSNRNDTILSGINTQNSPLFLVLNITTATTSALVCDIYGQMDIVLVIQDGQMSARW